jgi:hypothetical protein
MMALCIDQREVLDRLYKDMHKGIVGTVILSREDRLFRNKHMDQVGAFTKLAEERRIKVIVPRGARTMRDPAAFGVVAEVVSLISGMMKYPFAVIDQ